MLIDSTTLDGMDQEQHAGRQNTLSRSASAYLRSAMHQPVYWQEWGDEAFELAVRQDKPILLDVGAVWCHWCHVMDRESYENPKTAQIINEHFVAIKVDRDERPDVDSRYQAAVAAISGQGGWPLTAFLTPDGRPYFGGTYFPPDDRHGRPGLPRVLLTMAESFHKRRTEVDESAGSVMAAIAHNESFMGHVGNPGPELVAKLVNSILQQFDARSGGFGSQPKFPHSGAIDLLLDASSRILVGDGAVVVRDVRNAALSTLQKMARGGIYDHLAGGFHRYSVDERWVVPHFEKMSYDNSELLKNYVHGFQSFVDPEFARVAREIVGWMDECLSDRVRGGFYASQDADLSLDDDGDYFTWSYDEAAAVLAPGELAVASAYYDIGEIGEMHHNPAKNVLHVRGTLEGVAKLNALPSDEAKELLASAKEKLYAARLRRPRPYVDKTIYVGWNGMCISAYLEAGRVLNLPQAIQFALRSLDRVLAEAWNPVAGMKHVVSYGEGQDARQPVSGILDDYVFIGNAAVDAWEATGEIHYYNAAVEIADAVIARFYDSEGGAFFDTQAGGADRRHGALATTRKPLQDSPTPAGNAVAASLLIRLAGLNGREDYSVKALETLETFDGVVEHFGLYAASYGLALQRLVQRAVQVCIIGDNVEARRLESVALARYAVNKSVVRFRRDQMDQLPPSLAETLPHLQQMRPGESTSVAIVCYGGGCLPPVETVDELIGAMNQAL